MKLADNVFVHDPEVNLGQMELDRLRDNGWSEKVVQQQIRRRQQAVSEPVLEIHEFPPTAE